MVRNDEWFLSGVLRPTGDSPSHNTNERFLDQETMARQAGTSFGRLGLVCRLPRIASPPLGLDRE